MSNAEQAVKAGRDDAEFWATALQTDAAKALDTALANQPDAGTPAEASAANEAKAEDKQTPEPTAPEATTPTGTAEGKETQEEAPEAAVTGLDGVPEEYREVVAAALRTKEKQLQAGYTKKYQDLSQQRTEVAPLVEMQKHLGLDAKSLAEYAHAFKQLSETPGIRISQGDKILFEAKDAAQHDAPDLEAMTTTERNAYFQRELEKVKALAAEEAKKQVAPLVEQTERAAAAQKIVGWRASRKDVADDEIALAVALAQKFEQEVLPKGADAIDSYMAPFVALARSMKQQATASTPTKPSQPKTEVPRRETQSPKRSLNSLEDMAEEAARKAGFRSLNALLRSKQGD
jgi:hypothetical protein